MEGNLKTNYSIRLIKPYSDDLVIDCDDLEGIMDQVMAIQNGWADMVFPGKIEDEFTWCEE